MLITNYLVILLLPLANKLVTCKTIRDTLNANPDDGELIFAHIVSTSHLLKWKHNIFGVDLYKNGASYMYASEYNIAAAKITNFILSMNVLDAPLYILLFPRNLTRKKNRILTILLWTQSYLSQDHHLFLQLFRHGDRTPIDPYPMDPWKDRENWPEGYGQLTNVSYLC